MKFISGIKKVEVGKVVTIDIPIYHRTTISFFNGSEVYYHYRRFESNNFIARELILTPLKPEIWHHLRKVTLNAIDRPGVINAITTKLRDLKINVNIVEALTTELGAIHTITLIIDLSIYLENQPRTYTLNEAISSEIINDLELLLKDLKYINTDEKVIYNEQVFIKELTFLESISNTITNKKRAQNDVSFNFHLSHEHKVKMQKGIIELTEPIIRGLDLNCDSFYYTMFSDTEERYIKLLFFDPNQTVAFIDILHEDIYGAISRFTEIIHTTYEYNILASYSHQQMHKTSAQWYALIDISNRKQEFFSHTLDDLRSAEYGEMYDKKRVEEVFLIETNMDSIPEIAIHRFGQNKPTRDGEITSVYQKKKNVLEKFLKEHGKKAYQKDPDKFVERYGLHKTRSLKRFVNRIIKEQNKKRKKKLNFFIRWSSAIAIPLIIILVLELKFNFLTESLLHHLRDTVIIASLIIISVLIERTLKKYMQDGE